MSQIQEFWAQVRAGGILRDEWEALMTEGAGVPGDAIVALGGKHGLEFSLDDLQASLTTAAGTELAEAELDAVAGGRDFDHIGNFNFKVEINGVTVAAFKHFRPDD